MSLGLTETSRHSRLFKTFRQENVYIVYLDALRRGKAGLRRSVVCCDEVIVIQKTAVAIEVWAAKDQWQISRKANNKLSHKSGSEKVSYSGYPTRPEQGRGRCRFIWFDIWIFKSTNWLAAGCDRWISYKLNWAVRWKIQMLSYKSMRSESIKSVLIA